MMNPRSERELALSVQPIEELHEQRRALVEKSAMRWAKFGSFGTYQDLRKSELARIKMLLRAQYARDGVKVTEAQIDDEAHAHPDYLAMVAAATRGRAELSVTENAIRDIGDIIIRDGQLLRTIGGGL